VWWDLRAKGRKGVATGGKAGLTPLLESCLVDKLTGHPGRTVLYENTSVKNFTEITELNGKLQ
jgi:hypothetical protein